MRRLVIYGLLGLLAFIIILDFQPAAEDRRLPPTVAMLPSLTASSAVVAEQPTAAATATDAAPTLDLTRESVAMTVTQITADTAATALFASGVTHIIVSGDTPFRLAEQYGVSVDAIVRANNITDPTRLRVGQVILIPLGTPEDLIQPLPTARPVVAAASVPNPTPTRIAFEMGNVTPIFGAPPAAINGIAFEMIIVLPEETRQHVRQIYVQGQGMGNNPRAFSMLGDSTIEQPYFLGRFDEGPYNLGQYNYLKPVIDYFTGSFGRQSVAVRRGLHTWSVLDPMWSPKPTCQPGEHMLACEFRLNRPSILFVRLGTNDAGIPDSTDDNLREIVEYALASGVIPVLGTKADRHEGPGNINNDIMRRIAADYHIPLWDFDLIAQTLPQRGLAQDGVHLTTFYAHDYTQPEALQRGYGVYNLTALMMLDMLWREMYTVHPA